MLSPLDLLESRGLPRHILLLSEIEAETLDRSDDEERSSPPDAFCIGAGPSRRHSRSWNGSKTRRHALAVYSDAASHTESFSANSSAQARRPSLMNHRIFGQERHCSRSFYIKECSFGGPHHHKTFPGSQRTRRRSWVGVVSIISQLRETIPCAVKPLV